MSKVKTESAEIKYVQAGDKLSSLAEYNLDYEHFTDYSTMGEPQDTYFSGDRNDFTSIYHQLYPFIYSVARRFVEHEDAVDLVAGVFIKFWEREKEFNGILPVKMYLKASIRNACLNFLEHRRYKEEQLKELARTSAHSEFLDDTLGELKKRIALEIEKLPAQSRKIFKMAWIEGAKNKDIAEKLGLSVNTVRAQKQNALRFLRLHIGAADYLLLLFLLFNFTD